MMRGKTSTLRQVDVSTDHMITTQMKLPMGDRDLQSTREDAWSVYKKGSRHNWGCAQLSQAQHACVDACVASLMNN
jgi:hypothetical protein